MNKRAHALFYKPNKMKQIKKVIKEIKKIAKAIHTIKR